MSMLSLMTKHQDVQHYDTQQNHTHLEHKQHYDTQPNDTGHNKINQNDTKHNAIQYNGAQHPNIAA